MNAVSNESDGSHLVISLGSEEATILFQPGSWLRRVMDRTRALSSTARFLTPPVDGGGMLAILSCAAAAALLESPVSHPVERDLQELFFDNLAPDQLPPQKEAPHD